MYYFLKNTSHHFQKAQKLNSSCACTLMKLFLFKTIMEKTATYLVLHLLMNELLLLSETEIIAYMLLLINFVHMGSFNIVSNTSYGLLC